MNVDDESASASRGTDIGVVRTVFTEPAELLDHVGQRLGTSPWIVVTQTDVNDFARITGDEQWIHVDQERAAAGPFGATIVHGFFLLGLCATFIDHTVAIERSAMSINYGLDRVRFLSPVVVGSRIRCHADLTAAEAIAGGVRYSLGLTIEQQGAAKPACVATVVVIARND